MDRTARLPLVFLTLLHASLSPGAQPPAVSTSAPAAAPDEAVESARQAADDLTRTLAGRLMKELQAGGAAGAVRVCSEVAQSIAAAHSNATTRVRRVALKVRNPADAPDAYERHRLEEFAALHRDGRLPKESVEVVRVDGAPVLRYLRPILVGRPCLACHGAPEAIDPAARAILTTLYPDDAATGYREGDLRGAVSVTVELADAPETR